MIERQIVVPVDPAVLWEALTEPHEVGAWFGQRVDWDLSPGGRARWSGGGEGSRSGVIDEVAPGRRLRFRWWPESEQGPASEVTYELEPAGGAEPDGTRLTVRETLVPPPAETASPGTATADTASAYTWTSWDTRHAGLWLRLHAATAVRA
jgi:uncharacterized protein YndB with AHSA1/START domain